MLNAIEDRALWEAEAAERAEQGQTMDRPKRRLMVKGGETGINRLLARARALFNWAIGEGIIDYSPFKRHGVMVCDLPPSED